MPRGSQPKTYDAALVERVRSLYDAGHTQHEIGREIGLSQKVVFNVMRRHSIQARIAAKREQRGENNASWKGDKAGYHAFHRRLYALHGKPTQCSQCGTTESKNYDYANLTGNYNDLNDYRPMCRSCHWKLDKKVLNISRMRERLNV